MEESRNKLSETSAASVKKVVALGDSLTAGYGVRWGSGWVERLAQRYAGTIRFYNCGLPGDVTSGMVQRGTRYVAELHPDTLLFMGGSNDILCGEAIETILRHIRKIHRMCAEQQVRLILLQCPEISFMPGSYAWFLPEHTSYLHEQFRLLRTAIRHYAQQNHLVCLATEQLFPEGKAYENFLQPDGVHLREAAHEKIAEMIFSYKIL